jgi:hypothetical protein
VGWWGGVSYCIAGWYAGRVGKIEDEDEKEDEDGRKGRFRA